MRIMVTGATGFVGRALCEGLIDRGHEVVATARRSIAIGKRAVVTRWITVGEVGLNTDWDAALERVDAVVHLAARVHVMHEATPDALMEFRKVNVEGTVRLAQAAEEAGVRRFVHVSSIKVNGEGGDRPYREIDSPVPEDAYAISKWEAEQALHKIAQAGKLEVVVLRPPLVYGPGVKANFLTLINAVKKGWPLPLGAVQNRRSLLYLGNFVDALCLCVEHPSAPGHTFMIDDGNAVSTPELIRAVARSMGRPVTLLAVPIPILKWVGTLLGKRAAVSRLTGSLYLDSTAIRLYLGWRPPFTMAEGLAATVASSV